MDSDTESTLETPPTAASLYQARGIEVDPHRPEFTGDVFETRDGELALLLQHPCSMRRRDMLTQVLACAIQECPDEKPPRSWDSNYKAMPLPELRESQTYYRARFDVPRLLESSDLDRDARTATLSLYGVTLLMQRWVFHNSRLAVPTSRFDTVVVGPYEEADLAAEWIVSVAQGLPEAGIHAFDEWIRSTPAGETTTRQKLLENPVRRADVRRSMRTHLRTLVRPS